MAEVTPIAFTNISWKYYFVYACVDLAAVLVFFFLYPETKGRSLEEIDQIFIQSKSILDTVSVAKNMPEEGMLDIREIKQAVAKRETEHVEDVV